MSLHIGSRVLNTLNDMQLATLKIRQCTAKLESLRRKMFLSGYAVGTLVSVLAKQTNVSRRLQQLFVLLPLVPTTATTKLLVGVPGHELVQ